ncbi:hypothetical protein Ancab_025681 [Ancistrocladus abbreviatus]
MEFDLKHQKRLEEIEIGDGVDSLRKLPSEILCHLLSFLPTKDAVITGALATYWKSLWMLLPVFHMDDSLHYSPQLGRGNSESKLSFSKIVDKVLQENSAHYLDKFMVLGHVGYDTSCTHGWIRNAYGRNVTVLVLLIPLQEFTVPFHEILTSQSLLALKLGMLYNFDIPASDYSPSLNCIVLLHVKFPEANVISRPFTSFPALRAVYLVECYWDQVYVFKIQAPKLSTFHMLLVKNLQSPKYADVDIRFNREQWDYNFCSLDLIKRISNVTALCLSCHFFAVSFIGNRVHLFLENGGAHVVITISFCLKSSQVPDCLLKHVREIRLLSFRGLQNELNLVKYVLQHALVLKKLRINTCLINVQNSMDEKIQIRLLIRRTWNGFHDFNSRSYYTVIKDKNGKECTGTTAAMKVSQAAVVSRTSAANMAGCLIGAATSTNKSDSLTA